MSYPPPGGQDPYQQLPPPEPESNPYSQPTTPPPAYGSAYGTPYGGPAQMGPPATGNNGLSIASMITGIVSVLSCCCWPLGILAGGTAVTLGAIGMNQIKQRGQAGRGMAIAGIATGAAGVLISILMLILSFSGVLDNSSFLDNYR